VIWSLNTKKRCGTVDKTELIYTSWVLLLLKYLESFNMWNWRRIEKIGGTDGVKNKALQRVKEE
jgi:hypothetical protein